MPLSLPWSGVVVWGVRAARRPLQAAQALVLVLLASQAWSEESTAPRDIEVVRLSVRPAIFHVRSFASDAEAQELRKLAAGRYQPSGTSGRGDTRMDHEPFLKVRTSSSFYVSREDMQLEAVSKITKRIEDTLVSIVRESNSHPQPQVHVMNVNPRHAEVFQMSQYSAGEYYAAHSDYAKDNPAYDRAATFLLYLNAPPDGGETVFPYMSKDGDGATDGDRNPSTMYSWNRQTDFRQFQCETSNQSRVSSEDSCALPYCCCDELLSVKPVTGDAILFFPLKADGSKEEMAVHAACPVLAPAGGKKEVVQQWFHATHPDESSALYPQYKRGAKKGRRRKNRGG